MMYRNRKDYEKALKNLESGLYEKALKARQEQKPAEAEHQSE
ncbi:MAG: hypothetical protein PHU53_07635 [Thermoplasmata archaeon]|nr:hypothetical protein [Thermoplasmata archaeon]